MDFRKNLPFKSYSVKKAICKCVRSHREPFSRSFGTDETQHLREGQLVGRMLLQRLSTGATGVKQARYRRGPTQAARHSYAHAQYIHSVCSVPLCVCGHLLFNAWCNACILWGAICLKSTPFLIFNLTFINVGSHL